MNPSSRIDDLYQPTADWENWSVVSIRGYEFLGRIKGTLLTRVDIKAHASGKGTQLTPKGRKPSEVDVTLRIWRELDIQQLTQLLPMLQTLSNAAVPQAIEISHPALRLCGITSLYFRGNTIPEIASAKNEGVVTLKFIEFLSGLGTKKATGLAPTKDELSQSQAGFAAFLSSQPTDPQPVMSSLSDPNTPTGLDKFLLESAGFTPTPPSFTVTNTTK